MPKERRYTGETKSSWSKRKSKKGSDREKLNKRARKKYGKN